MKKDISICMFDMGGVIARHSDALIEKKVLRELGVEEYDRFSDLNEKLDTIMLEHTKGNISETEVWEAFSLVTGQKMPAMENSLWGKYFNPTLDSTMVTLVQELREKGMRIICATNTEPAHYAFHMARGDYSLFDKVYASVDLHMAKPDIRFFEEILARENLGASQIFFTDDSKENCESARSCGMKAYLFTNSSNLRTHLSDIEIL
ncbi:HAD family phosphatase [uncultured Sphaerochaeta sp.]|uniref:HAD family hydrolase n=1 Tax=uncultured Sphaerochaeta sp. TaxID=886478 RepID=UPI002A0A3743|nr:HAD family phosphatase [uncultured Sphaerochaeta sp.]